MTTTFNVAVTLEDDHGRQTRKSYQLSPITDTDVGAEYLAARAVAAGLITDLAALSEARVLSYEVKERVVYSDVAGTDSNIDEGLTLGVRKADNAKATLKVPAPVMSVFDVQDIADLSDALITAYYSNFIADVTLSDGELATELLSGRLDK